MNCFNCNTLMTTYDLSRAIGDTAHFICNNSKCKKHLHLPTFMCDILNDKITYYNALINTDDLFYQIISEKQYSETNIHIIAPDLVDYPKRTIACSLDTYIPLNINEPIELQLISIIKKLLNLVAFI